MDPNVPKLCIVLHDPEEALHIDQTVIAQLKHICPTHVMHVNSAPATEAASAVVPDIWAPFLAETFPLLSSNNVRRPSEELFHFRARANSIGQSRGSRLSQQDFASIDSFVKEFLAPRVYETIARQMQIWEKEVASARRGISGRLFKVGLKYFGSSKSGPPPAGSTTDPTSQTTIFPFASQEMIMRRLADYAFMIRDYKYAQAIYESVKKDFATNEKYYKFFAGVQEMLAYIAILQSPSSGFESAHTAAVQAYQDAKVPLYGDRTTMWVVELIKEYGAYRDAAFTLIKMAKDDSDLKCGLFLEQAAICFIRGVPSLPRRYAFHLFLAAFRFGKCGLKDHSERNYTTALEIYGDLGWNLITDHIHFSLGKQSISKSQFETALDLFMKLLHRSRQTATIHRGFLAEFLYLYQQYSGMVDPAVLQEKLSKLPIPVFSQKVFRVLVQESQLRANSHTDQPQVWQEMEQDLMEYVTSSKYDGNKGIYSKTSAKQASTNHESAVGEPIHFQFEWSNPLQVPIPVNNIYLDCLFNEQLVVFPAWGESEPPSWLVTDQLEMEVLTDMALDANEKKVVSIKIVPKMQGQIKIVGLRYLLCGIISTSRILEVSDKVSFTIDVTPPMPVLDFSFHNFPDEMLAGQVNCATLELHNRGGKGLHGLVAKISHPNFCLFGDPTSTEEQTYGNRI
jgi:tetratricopeptide (TPR) repeat protein